MSLKYRNERQQWAVGHNALCLVEGSGQLHCANEKVKVPPQVHPMRTCTRAISLGIMIIPVLEVQVFVELSLREN